MKRFLIIAAFAVAGLSLSSCKGGEDLPDLRILTFEDADYKAGENYIGETSWSSLVDDPQYGGALLYGEYDEATYTYFGSGYRWYDENNTFLRSEVLSAESYAGDGTMTTAYSNGGQAVSDYASTDIAANSDYLHQLTVYAEAGKGGHNGSRNFCVQNGSDAGFEFGDGVERVIDHMYVNSTNYLYNSYLNGNGFNNPATEADSFKVVATGYDGQGNVTSTSTFELGKGRTCIQQWTKWDLRSLGKVMKVTFTFEGTDMGEWGLNTPTYFAFDDVAVQF